MSYDALIETPQLPFDRERIRKGGDGLADYMQEFVSALQNQYLTELNRMANHFRGWWHASDFNKIDGGDHYAGSVATAAAALNAWTNPQSAYTALNVPVGDSEGIDQTLVINATGQTIILLWGGYIGYSGAPTGVKIRLYRDSTLLRDAGPVLTASGYTQTIFQAYVEAPSAGSVTYTMRDLTTVPGGAAVVGDRTIIALECKR